MSKARDLLIGLLLLILLWAAIILLTGDEESCAEQAARDPSIDCSLIDRPQ